jgi:hypothetical protein
VNRTTLQFQKVFLLLVVITLRNTLHESYSFASFPGISYRRDSSVGIATGYGLDHRGVGVRVQVGSRIFSSTRRPDRFWGPSSLLLNRNGGLFPRG